MRSTEGTLRSRQTYQRLSVLPSDIIYQVEATRIGVSHQELDLRMAQKHRKALFLLIIADDNTVSVKWRRKQKVNRCEEQGVWATKGTTREHKGKACKSHSGLQTMGGFFINILQISRPEKAVCTTRRSGIGGQYFTVRSEAQWGSSKNKYPVQCVKFSVGSS